MRFLIPLLPPALLLAAACGGDDDGGDTAGTPSDTAASRAETKDASSTETADATGTRTFQPTPLSTESPIRRPVAYDHYGENITDILGYYNSKFGNGVAVPVICPYDPTDIVIDCTAEGYGRIALDIEPFGGDVTECRAMLSPGGAELVAASCNVSTLATFFYKIVE